VILFGHILRRWKLALTHDRMRALPGIRDVLRVRRLPQLWMLRRSVRRESIVLCFAEASMRTCPRDGWMLMPSREALEVLGNKRRFARYAQEQGLGQFVPHSFDAHEAVPYPAVLKLERSSAGSGVAVVRSATELAAARRRLRGSPFRSMVLQELVEGRDHVTHAICRDGRLLWHCTYDYELRAGDVVQTHENVTGWQRGMFSPAEVAALERFLLPLGFDGPIAVDFKRRADGRLCVIEINPRFGGSLMRPEHADDLDAALAVLLANAKPPHMAASGSRAQ